MARTRLERGQFRHIQDGSVLTGAEELNSLQLSEGPSRIPTFSPSGGFPDENIQKCIWMGVHVFDSRNIGAAARGGVCTRRRVQSSACAAGGRIRDVLFGVRACHVRLCGVGALYDRAKNEYGKRLAGMDSHRKYYFDAEYCKETDLVDCSLPDTAGQHSDLHHHVDGDCGSTQ